jgi:hypothetical protein
METAAWREYRAAKTILNARALAALRAENALMRWYLWRANYDKALSKNRGGLARGARGRRRVVGGVDRPV